MDLKVEIDDEPRYHGNIVNWPESKDEQLQKAQDLSRLVANFVIYHQCVE